MKGREIPNRLAVIRAAALALASGPESMTRVRVGPPLVVVAKKNFVPLHASVSSMQTSCLGPGAATHANSLSRQQHPSTNRMDRIEAPPTTLLDHTRTTTAESAPVLGCSSITQCDAIQLVLAFFFAAALSFFGYLL
jgi:hypothetical protein